MRFSAFFLPFSDGYYFGCANSAEGQISAISSLLRQRCGIYFDKGSTAQKCIQIDLKHGRSMPGITGHEPCRSQFHEADSMIARRRHSVSRFRPCWLVGLDHPSVYHWVSWCHMKACRSGFHRTRNAATTRRLFDLVGITLQRSLVCLHRQHNRTAWIIKMNQARSTGCKIKKRQAVILQEKKEE
jgi:hypothetical protein